MSDIVNMALQAFFSLRNKRRMGKAKRAHQINRYNHSLEMMGTQALPILPVMA
jgi:hypothetical protein